MFSRGILLHLFYLKKNVSESSYFSRCLGEHALTEQMCQKWFTLFESGNFNIKYEEQTCTSKKFEEDVDDSLKVTRYTNLRRSREKFYSEMPGYRSPIPVPSPKKAYLLYVLLHYFFMKKNATESYIILERIHGIDQVLAERTCHKRFKSGNFNLEDSKPIDSSKMFEDYVLIELLNENPSRTQKEIAKILRVSQQAISYRLKVLGITRKDGKWIA